MMAPDQTQPPISIPVGVPLLLRDLLHEHAGIFFDNDRFDTLIEKLRGRVEALGLRSYLDYYYRLKYEADAEQEWRLVMDAFSVQETYFWRETAQLEAVIQEVLPRWFAEHPHQTLRIWSAACATGEEPYSLAMTIQEAGWGGHPIQILASDASESALARARAGLYRERSFRTLPPQLRARYFERPTEDGSRIRADLLPPVSFHRANIVDPRETAALATCPVVFCRNVFIYFSPDAIRRTVASFAASMPSGSHLFVGASESLLKLTSAFEIRPLGDAFVYVRNRTHEPLRAAS